MPLLDVKGLLPALSSPIAMASLPLMMTPIMMMMMTPLMLHLNRALMILLLLILMLIPISSLDPANIAGRVDDDEDEELDEEPNNDNDGYIEIP